MIRSNLLTAFSWCISPFRSNLGLEKRGWDDLQSSAYGASNDVVFNHLDEHFQDVDVQNFSCEAWEELKEDMEGFPFNGRTLNRTNVESCILHYLRHTSNLQLAASFSAYLRENGGFHKKYAEENGIWWFCFLVWWHASLILSSFSGGLQPLHYKQLLALYTDVKNLGDAEEEVGIEFLSLAITLRLLRWNSYVSPFSLKGQDPTLRMLFIG